MLAWFRGLFHRVWGHPPQEGHPISEPSGYVGKEDVSDAPIADALSPSYVESSVIAEKQPPVASVTPEIEEVPEVAEATISPAPEPVTQKVGHESIPNEDEPLVDFKHEDTFEAMEAVKDEVVWKPEMVQQSATPYEIPEPPQQEEGLKEDNKDSENVEHATTEQTEETGWADFDDANTKATAETHADRDWIEQVREEPEWNKQEDKPEEEQELVAETTSHVEAKPEREEEEAIEEPVEKEQTKFEENILLMREGIDWMRQEEPDREDVFEEKTSTEPEERDVQNKTIEEEETPQEEEKEEEGEEKDMPFEEKIQQMSEGLDWMKQEEEEYDTHEMSAPERHEDKQSGLYDEREEDKGAEHVTKNAEDQVDLEKIEQMGEGLDWMKQEEQEAALAAEEAGVETPVDEGIPEPEHQEDTPSKTVVEEEEHKPDFSATFAESIQQMSEGVDWMKEEDGQEEVPAERHEETQADTEREMDAHLQERIQQMNEGMDWMKEEGYVDEEPEENALAEQEIEEKAHDETSTEAVETKEAEAEYEPSFEEKIQQMSEGLDWMKEDQKWQDQEDEQFAKDDRTIFTTEKYDVVRKDIDAEESAHTLINLNDEPKEEEVEHRGEPTEVLAGETRNEGEGNLIQYTDSSEIPAQSEQMPHFESHLDQAHVTTLAENIPSVDGSW